MSFNGRQRNVCFPPTSTHQSVILIVRDIETVKTLMLNKEIDNDYIHALQGTGFPVTHTGDGYWTYFTSLWLPSTCHNEFGPATQYVRLWTALVFRKAQESGSILCMQSRIRCLEKYKRWLWSLARTEFGPIRWFPRVIDRTSMSSCSLVIVERSRLLEIEKYLQQLPME